MFPSFISFVPWTKNYENYELKEKNIPFSLSQYVKDEGIPISSLQTGNVLKR